MPYDHNLLRRLFSAANIYLIAILFRVEDMQISLIRDSEKGGVSFLDLLDSIDTEEPP